MPTRFGFKDNRCSEFVQLIDIVRFEASRNYTRVFLSSKEIKVVCSPICSQYEKVKSSGLFFRIHRSHVINLQYVTHIFNNGTVKLKDGTQLPCNPKEKEELLLLMEK